MALEALDETGEITFAVDEAVGADAEIAVGEILVDPPVRDIGAVAAERLVDKGVYVLAEVAVEVGEAVVKGVDVDAVAFPAGLGTSAEQAAGCAGP